MRRVLRVTSAPRGHWVGDGFPVRSLFSHASHGEEVSPFLLLDYAGPAEFPPAETPRGVDVHPHRGFETVTIVYQGEVEHHDSTGAGGKIGPGDVQWMTAASGILHKEFHSHDFTAKGGPFEMVQLWVNLPARFKDEAPGYQTLAAADIPAVELPDGAGRARIIAGRLGETQGPARTFTPINVWDVRLGQGKAATLSPPDGHAVTVVTLAGAVTIGAETLREAETATLSRDGGEVTLTAVADARLLVLTGEPIDEPVVMHGPFVMNTRARSPRRSPTSSPAASARSRRERRAAFGPKRPGAADHDGEATCHDIHYPTYILRVPPCRSPNGATASRSASPSPWWKRST